MTVCHTADVKQYLQLYISFLVKITCRGAGDFAVCLCVRLSVWPRRLQRPCEEERPRTVSRDPGLPLRDGSGVHTCPTHAHPRFTGACVQRMCVYPSAFLVWQLIYDGSTSAAGSTTSLSITALEKEVTNESD